MANLKKINDLRKQKLLSWKELSEQLNISIVGIQRIISTNSTKIETLEKIASFFNVPVSYFFDESNTNAQDLDKIKEELNTLKNYNAAIEGNYNVLKSLYAGIVKKINNSNCKELKKSIVTDVETFKLLDKNNEALLND